MPKNPTRLKDHIETHIEGLSFSCDICGESFDTKFARYFGANYFDEKNRANTTIPMAKEEVAANFQFARLPSLVPLRTYQPIF